MTLRNSSGNVLNICGALTKNDDCLTVLTQSAVPLPLHLGIIVVLLFIGILLNPGFGYRPMMILYVEDHVSFTPSFKAKDSQSVDSFPVVHHTVES